MRDEETHPLYLNLENKFNYEYKTFKIPKKNYKN